MEATSFLPQIRVDGHGPFGPDADSDGSLKSLRRSTGLISDINPLFVDEKPMKSGVGLLPQLIN